MRPHVCIPSGTQQWVSKTVAVGVDKFAYMSSLAIYVYSSYSYLPLAILAKHERHLSALALSPFDANYLACAISNQELRVYDVDTELPVCIIKYNSPKAPVSALEWHRSHAGILLVTIGSHLYAWDVTAALATHANKTTTSAADDADAATTTHNDGATLSAAPPPAPPSQPPPRSMLARLKSHGAAALSSAGASATRDAPPSGRWVFLRDLHVSITAFDQCAAAPGGAADGATLLAAATTDSRVVILELEPSGLAVRREIRSVTLMEPGRGGGGDGGGGSAAAAAAAIPVSAVCWEPLSCNGQQLLLAVSRSGTMALYDSATGEAVLQYNKQPATASRFAAFLPAQPGNFLCSSSRSGALQLWNVSQSHPLRLFKLGGGLVQGFTMLRSPPGSTASAAAAASNSSSNNNKRSSSSSNSSSSLALVSFTDGSLCVYDLGSQQAVWRQEGGHTETIFDCRFCTTDPNLLATASFDSTVRVWDVRSGQCVRQLGGAEGILYSVSWSADGRLLAAASDAGVVYLYDMGRGLLVKALRQHTKQALKVAFHPHKPGLLASCSLDGSVVVFTAEGDTLRTLRHSTPVSGLAWSCAPAADDSASSPSESSSSSGTQLLATTCESGRVHVWDVGRPGEECLVRTLERHTSRAFGVEFSPLRPAWLLSSSNDRTARVWDAGTGDCIAVLQGHTAEVRAVAWHPEVAHVCFTGSWDASIRVWDARSGACLHVATDHHADVYGLSCHPARPFLLASCSRDTTIRLWSTLDLTPHLLPQALVQPLSSLLCPAEEAAQRPPAAPALLSGAGSRQLAGRLGEEQRGGAAGGAAPLERFAAICEFFLPPACMDVFWDLARTTLCTNSTTTANSSNIDANNGSSSSITRRHSGAGGSTGPGSLHHWTAAKLAVESAANHLELAACSKSRASGAFGGGGGGGGGCSRREELLRSAAQQHLVAGDVEHSCELLAQLGEWDRALALAPVVGLALWRRLLGQRLAALAEAEAQGGGAAQSHVSDVLPLYLVSGQVPALVEMLSASEMYDTAFNVAAVHASGGYASLSSGAGGEDAAASGGGGGGSRERCNGGGGHVSNPGGGDYSASTPTAAAASVPLHPPSPLGADRALSVPNGEIPNGPSSNPVTTAASSSGGAAGSSSSGGAAGRSSSGVVTLPPVTLRGSGTQPSLSRIDSHRPPPLAPIHTSSSASSLLSSLALSSAHASATPQTEAAVPTPQGVGGAASSSSTPLLRGDSLMALPLPLQPIKTPRPSASGLLLPPPPLATATAASPAAAARPVSAARLRSSQAGKAGGSAGATGSSSRDGGGGAFERAVSVRCSQARGFLAAGQPLHAACCALSVDDVAGAVGVLLRGGMEEVAAALGMALAPPSPQQPSHQQYQHQATCGSSSGGWGLGSGWFGVGLAGAGGGGGGGGGGAAEAVAAALRPRVLAAAAQRREAAGDYLTAAELLKQVPGRSDLRDLLAGRCRAQAADPRVTARVFETLGMQAPETYIAANATALVASAAAADGGGGWASVRQLLLAGLHEAAAEAALAGVRRLVEGGRRVTLTCPEWEQAWGAINSLCASSLPPAVWAAVFSQAAYLGALLALEQGDAAVGLYLLRVLEAWVGGGGGKQGAALPVSPARMAAEVSEALDACLALPAYGSSAADARQVLRELVAAPQGTLWLQGVLQSRLATAEARLLPSPPAPPSGPAPPSVTSPARSPSRSFRHSVSASGNETTANGGGGGGGKTDGPVSPPSGNPWYGSGRRLTASAGGSSGGGGGLRLGALDLGAAGGGSSGRISGVIAAGGGGGASLAAALAAFSPAGGGSSGTNGETGPSGSCSSSSPSLSCGLVELARGPVVVAAAHVPSRYCCSAATTASDSTSPSSSPAASVAAAGGAQTATAAGLMGPAAATAAAAVTCMGPRSVVSGCVIRGAAVRLEDGGSWVALSEAVALRRVLSYSPLGTGKLLLLP